jgi:DNA helicase-2/ATP-dependent DNA helicase PcrA
VFLPGWEEGLFPNQRSLDENGRRALEEERRLAYVGLTRARSRAIISHAANRRMHGSWIATLPSRFIEELPSEHLEIEVDQGLYGGGTSWSGSSWGGAYGGNATWGESRTSPGFSRAKSRKEAVRYIEATAEEVTALPSGDFAVGVRVFHQKFGYGAVKRAEGEKLTISFEKAGEKKVMASFVVPADQAT